MKDYELTWVKTYSYDESSTTEIVRCMFVWLVGSPKSSHKEALKTSLLIEGKSDITSPTNNHVLDTI